MRKLIISLMAGFVVLAPAYCDIKISYLSGPVAIFHNNKWAQADTKTVLSAQDKIKTVANSRAVVTVDEITRVWVSPNTEMDVSSAGNENFFSLLAGKIRAKVKLLSGKKFQVRTPVAVASIRGTEFVISSEGQLSVLEGRVEFSDLSMSRSMEVAEGQVSSYDANGIPAAPREMTQQEKAKVSEEWQNFEQSGAKNDSSGEEHQKNVQKDEIKGQVADLQKEIYEIVTDIKNDIQTEREITNEIKESDLSAGRTLRDVHGNLVRVEQHLLRPDSQTLQLLNLTKRSDYNYGDKQHWGFSVPAGSRLDVMDVTIKMNMSLPEQITEWPSYISSKGDNMHPEKIDVKITNQQDEMKFSGDWKLKGQADEQGKILNDDRIVFNSYINGWKVDPGYEPKNDPNAKFTDGKNGDGNSTGDLWMWNISPQLKITKDGESDRYVRVYNEVYAINNDGKILNMNNLTSSSENPFTVLKQVAGEQIVFVRNLDNTDFLKRGNLDLVYTPDLAIAVAEKLATQAGDLMKNNSSGK